MTTTEKIKVRDLQYVLSKQYQHLDDVEGYLLNYRKCMLFYLSNNRTAEFEMVMEKYRDCSNDKKMTISAITRLQQNILLLGGTLNG